MGRGSLDETPRLTNFTPGLSSRRNDWFEERSGIKPYERQKAHFGVRGYTRFCRHAGGPSSRRGPSSKTLPNRRKQRENDRENVVCKV